jgi:hypothetical protein
MKVRFPRSLGYVLVAAFLASASHAWAQAPALTPAQIQEFLRTAEVIAAERTSTGVTQPWRLTLTDGAMTHDAAFQSVDQREDVQRLGRSRELNFVDSYRYNIAAYRLAALVGLEDMIPVTVERRWNGQVGALSWWIDDVMFDEATRIEEQGRPDDVAAWSAQMARMLVFGELVHDTDRNRTNILYTRDWKVYMIDFTRAFRMWDRLQRPEDLTRIDRQLFERLKTLRDSEVAQAAAPHLKDGEVTGVLKRREKLIDHFQRLISERGESRVLN